MRTGPLEEPASFSAYNRLRVWAGSQLTVAALKRDAGFWSAARESREHCLLDLSQVQAIDSTGVALLLHWRKALAEHSRKLVLLTPSVEVKRVLAALRLATFFFTTDQPEETQPLLQRIVETRLPVHLTHQESPALAWRDEITAVNIDEVWQLTLQHLETLATRQSRVVIDLSHLRFIDSSGLGLMLRLKHWTQSAGLDLSFTDPQRNVQNVLHLAQLEQVLLTASE